MLVHPEIMDAEQPTWEILKLIIQAQYQITAIGIVVLIAIAVIIIGINWIGAQRKVKKISRELNAKMNSITEELQKTKDEIQNMVKLISKIELSLLIRSGRLGGVPAEEKEIIKNDILDFLTQIKMPKEEQEIVLDEWNKFIIFDYVNCILGGPTIPIDVSKDEMNQWKQLRRRGINDYPKPDELTTFLQRCSFLTDKRKELIEDYKYFIKNKKHRRPEEWNNRDNWGVLVKNDS